jgi:hypothetical protein
MTLVLDAGALIALERHDRAAWETLKAAWQRDEDLPVTHGGVLGRAWRGKGPRSALLSMALDGIEVRPLDAALGRKAGELLALTRGSDVIDAALVLLARDDDQIATSDPEDLRALVEAAGRFVELIPA